jgi:hypothetical protein
MIQKRFFPLVIVCAFTTRPALAIDNLSSPYVDQGKTELEWRGEIYHDDDDDSADGGWQQRAAVGYGFTDHLGAKAEAEFEHDSDSDDTDFKSVNLEAKWEFAERGEWFVDTGVKAKYKFNANDGPDKAEIKLMFAKDTGPFNHRANMDLEREVGEDSDDDTSFNFAWSSRYKYSDAFQPGFETYNEFGSISENSDFDEETHKIGPVLYGKSGQFKYEAGYLVGISDASPDGTVKAMLGYEFAVK